MDFSLTEEQEILIQSVKELAIREIKPWIRYIDQKRDSEEGHNKAREIYKKAYDFGLTGLGFPEEYGGTKADPLTIGLVAETLARYGGLAKLESGSALYGSTGSAMILAKAANGKIKEDWIPKMISGERFLGIGSTEPQSGSDVSQIKMRATKEKDSD